MTFYNLQKRIENEIKETNNNIQIAGEPEVYVLNGAKATAELILSWVKEEIMKGENK